MKKKVSISSGSIEPDINALAKELEGLMDKKDECAMKRDWVGVAKVNAQILEYQKRIEYLEKTCRRSLSDLLEGQPQEVRDRFHRNCMLIILLADLMSGAAMEVQNALAKIGPKHLNVMPVIDTISKNASALVRLVDTKTDGDAAEAFGEFSDTCYWLLMNRTMVYLENEEKKKEQRLKQNRNGNSGIMEEMAG
jgi:hypothetical protein